MPRDARATGRSAELEALRILRDYRRLVLLGRVRLPLAEARRLVGPDCAFHLYFRHAEANPPAERTASAPRRRSASMRRGVRRRG
jgi:hypothetical protein